MKLTKIDYLIVVIIITSIVITIIGINSYDTSNSYLIENQYGESVRIWGSGIYRYDSYFKAPIFIGTDYVVLFIMVPMLIIALIKRNRKKSIKTNLFLTSVVSVSLYYSTSIAFGVTYNRLHLLYILLFACSFFALILLIADINRDEFKSKQQWELPTKAITAFLIVSGISLFVAWLPDIIPSIISGKSLSLIEVYTTEITYVLDMGIVSPVIFICLYQLKRQQIFGCILLAIILKTCEMVGVMIILQTLFQVLAEIEVPIPVIITKVGIFILLAVFSLYFDVKLYKNITD